MGQPNIYDEEVEQKPQAEEPTQPTGRVYGSVEELIKGENIPQEIQDKVKQMSEEETKQ